jgi:long-chain fatty acid transport protein
MRISRVAVAVLLPFALLGSHVHASGFENSGLGTTARGMGGAFRAIADDWSATYYNPAGLAFIVDNQIGGGLGLIHYRNEITPGYTATDEFGNEYGWGIVNGQTRYNSHRILNNPSAGLVFRLPVAGETVFGLSAYQPFDQSLRWRLFDLGGAQMLAYNSDTTITSKIPGQDHLIDLDVVAFQASAAKTFMEEKLAIGVGLQLLRADLWFTDLAFRNNPRGDANAMVDDRPRDRIPEFTDSQGRGWGLGLRGGIQYKLNEKINLAASLYMPFNITIKGTTRYTFVMPRAQYLWKDVEANSADYLFVAGDVLNQSSDFEVKLKLPPSISCGAAYLVNEKLTVELDAEYTFWSKYDGLEFKFSNFKGTPAFEQAFFQTDLSNPVDWDNAGKISLGARYLLHPKLTLLAGVSADQSPARNSTEFTPQFMDLGTKKSINGGGVFHFNQWDLGVITSYYSYPDINLVGLTDLNDDGTFDNFPGEYKASTYETVLSFGYRF